MSDRAALACEFCPAEFGCGARNLAQGRRLARESGWTARQHPTEPGPFVDICPECTGLRVFEEMRRLGLL